MRRLKLIWDFRGPDASKTAEHHEIHLKEYAIREDLQDYKTAYEDLNKMYSIAFIIVYERDMISIRDALRPHKGEVYEGEF